ncbi:MAG: preprotein translocase subunit YajC [Candidatus Nanopelagicales bacterium]|nr:preprotein translocase subunit YajC [Candidatus Nanopelagicales bacterium]MCU0298146.1 preprotein translocase subunit YajC [Candidatus Nanopelagicales bacterium]
MEFLMLAIPLILLGGLWLVMIRPLRQRQREAQSAQMAVHEGARIMTTAGIFGTVRWVEEETIGLEISDGVVVKYARAAVADVLDDEG